jgi:hypothetical protein
LRRYQLLACGSDSARPTRDPLGLRRIERSAPASRQVHQVGAQGRDADRPKPRRPRRLTAIPDATCRIGGAAPAAYLNRGHESNHHEAAREEGLMPPTIFGAAIAAMLLLYSNAADAAAWCLQSPVGSLCRFQTLEQCQASLVGPGTYCVQDLTLEPQPAKPSKKTKSKN